MDYLQREGNAILFQNDGEILRLEPWGENSLRVWAAILLMFKDRDYALLPPAQTQSAFDIVES